MTLMKALTKLVSTSLLVATSALAASWTGVGEDASGTYFADATAIEKSGTTAKMWSILDYKGFQRMVEVGYWSQKSQVEYDCAAPRMRGLSVALLSEKMGGGKPVYEDHSAHDWEDIAAGSMSEALRKVACK